MSYEEFAELLMSKAENGEYISEDVALDYLGDDVVNAVEEMYTFCRDYGFRIFSHGVCSGLTGDVTESMFDKGYILSSESLSKEEFENITGVIDVEEKMKIYYPNIEVSEDRFRSNCSLSKEEYDYGKLSDCKNFRVTERGKQKNIVMANYDIFQNFCDGELSYVDLCSRFIVHNGGSPCDLMFFVVVPEDKRTCEQIASIQYCCTMIDDTDGPTFDYYQNEVIESQCIAMCVDIGERKVIYNGKFDCKHLVDDFSFASAFTISDDFIENINMARRRDAINSQKAR